MLQDNARIMLMLESLSNNVTGLQAVSLVTILKKDLETDVSEPAVYGCSNVAKLFQKYLYFLRKNYV